MDEDQVILQLEEQAQTPKSRRLLAESDWDKHQYFALGKLTSKKKEIDQELQKTTAVGTKKYYSDLTQEISDLEAMASGVEASEEEEAGTYTVKDA